MPFRNRKDFINPNTPGAGLFKRRHDRREEFKIRTIEENERDGKQERITADSPQSPYTTRPRNYEEAKEHFGDTVPKQIRERDRQTNEPIPADYNTWKNNVYLYDWPRVDTIPEDEINKRGDKIVNTAVNKDFTPRRMERYTPAGIRGTTEPDTQEIITEKNPVGRSYTMFAEGTTEAHEVGHAIDFTAGNGIGSHLHDQVLDNPELRDQAETLSRRMRGSFDLWNERDTKTEQMADAFSSMLLEPRAAEREAPELVDTVDTELQERTGVGLDEFRDWPDNPL